MDQIEQMQQQLHEMIQELGQLKQTFSSQEKEIDFQQISANGVRYPIPEHPLLVEDEYVKKCYITLLLSVASLDKEHLLDSLVFAHRIAFGACYLEKGEDLQDEFKLAQIMTMEQLDEFTSCLSKEEVRMMLVLEMMLTSGTFGKGKKIALEYIGQLCVLLNITKDQIVFLSNMAAVILTGDLEQYNCDIQNKYTAFDGYLQDLDFKRNLILVPEIKNELAFGKANAVSFNFSGRYKLVSLSMMKEDKHIIFNGKYKESSFLGLSHEQQVATVFGGNSNYKKETRIPSKDFDNPFYIFIDTISDSKDYTGTPIGVETTHPLDNETMAYNYFELNS